MKDVDHRLISLESHGIGIHSDVPPFIGADKPSLQYMMPYARHREYGSRLPFPDARLRTPVRGIPQPPQPDATWRVSLREPGDWTWLTAFWQIAKHGIYMLFHAHTPAEPDYFDVFPLRNRLYTSGGQSNTALLTLMKTIEEQLHQDDAESVDYEQPQTQYPDVPPCPRGATWLHTVKPLPWTIPHRTYEEMRDDVERFNPGRGG